MRGFLTSPAFLVEAIFKFVVGQFIARSPYLELPVLPRAAGRFPNLVGLAP